MQQSNIKLRSILLRSIKNSGLTFYLKQLLLIIISILVLYPLFFVLMTSFKTNMEVIKYPFSITSFHPENYVVAWKIGLVGKYFMNSVITTVSTLCIQIPIIILASYSLGRLHPRGYNIIMILILSGMFVTSEMTTLPTFMLLRNTGLLSTRLALILPYVAGGLVLPIYIASKFISNIPKEIEEAAKMDGCGILETLIRIDLPLIKPIIATIFIINFQGTWSEFYWALIVVKNEAFKTLSLGMLNFQSQYVSNYGVLSAGLVILTLPIVLVYIFNSKYFIEGMAEGSVKG